MIYIVAFDSQPGWSCQEMTLGDVGKYILEMCHLYGITPTDSVCVDANFRVAAVGWQMVGDQIMFERSTSKSSPSTYVDLYLLSQEKAKQPKKLF